MTEYNRTTDSEQQVSIEFVPGLLDRTDLCQRRRQEVDVLRQVVQERPQAWNHVHSLSHGNLVESIFAEQRKHEYSFNILRMLIQIYHLLQSK